MRKFLIILFVFAISFQCYANNVRTFTLSKFISLVLEKNLNIQSYKLNKDISFYNIEKYISEFDANLNFNLNKSFNKEFTGSTLQSATSKYYVSKNSNWNFSISKKFLLGTEVALSFSNNRFETNSNWSILNPSYSSKLRLELTQPLLKGAGIFINKAEILKAKNRLKTTEYNVKNYINNVILDSSYKFFNLLYGFQKYKVEQESLKLAKDILKIDKKKLKLGLVPKNIIKESEAEVAARKEAVIKAYQELLNLSDDLKKSINEIFADYIVKPIYHLTIEPLNINLKKSIKYALAHRYEIKEINKKIQNANIDIKKSKNSLLPELNLNLYGGISGKGEDYSDNFNRMKEGKYREWMIGLEFRYPLGNRLNKANFKTAAILKQQLILQKKEITNQIIFELKKSYRNLKTLLKKIEANKRAYETAKIKLEIEEKKYEKGLSTPFQVFSYQNDYIEEKLNLIYSKISYCKEVLNFRKLSGYDLFQKKN